MIVQRSIGGRDALVAYLTADLKPSTEADAELVKIIFADGEVIFAVPANDNQPAKKFVHAEHLAKARRKPVRGRTLPPPRVDEAELSRAQAALAGALAPFLKRKAREIAGKIAPALAKADTSNPWSDPRIGDVLDELKRLQAEPEGPDRDEAIARLRQRLRDLVDEALSLTALGDWTVLVNPTVRELRAVHESGAKDALQLLGMADDRSIVNQVNEDGLKFATERAGELIGKRYDEANDTWIENPNAQWRIDETTRGMIASDVVTAVEEGWSVSKLADQLENNYAFSPARADMVARTETNRSMNAGNMAGYRRSGTVIGKVWLAGNESPDGVGDEPCDECADNADEGVIDLDDVFPSGDDAPPAHPNCRCAVAPVTGEEEGEGEEE